MQLHQIVLNDERNVRLTALIQNVGGEFVRLEKRPAILILPGAAMLSVPAGRQSLLPWPTPKPASRPLSCAIQWANTRPGPIL